MGNLWYYQKKTNKNYIPACLVWRTMAGTADEAILVEIDLNSYERLAEKGQIQIKGPEDKMTVVRLREERLEAESLDFQIE